MRFFSRVTCLNTHERAHLDNGTTCNPATCEHCYCGLKDIPHEKGGMIPIPPGVVDAK